MTTARSSHRARALSAAASRPRPSRRSVLGAASFGSLGLALAACGSSGGGSDADGGKPRVTTSCYPMDFLVQRVGGEHVEITSLAKPGVDPHGLELSVREVAELEKSDLILQILGYQNALDDAISSRGLEKAALDVSTVVELLPNTGADHDHTHDGESSDDGGEHDEHEGHDHEGHDHGDHDEHDHEGHDHGDHDEHGHEDHDDHAHDEHDHGASDSGGDDHDEHDGHDHEGHEGHEGHDHDHGAFDPHMWHDPELMAQVGEAIAERLGTLVPEQKQTFTDAATTLRTELEELDTELKTAFDGASGSKTFVTSHTAFAYLAHRYNLHQVGISGVDPETEPSPARLLEVEQTVKDEGVSTIFFETTASPKVAESLAQNLGVTAEELDNLETQLSPDADYPAVMRENCEKLVASFG